LECELENSSPPTLYVARWGAIGAERNLLLLSYGAEETTSLLEITPDGFEAFESPLFDTKSRTVATGSLRGGWCVQVTPSKVAFISPTARSPVLWEPPRGKGVDSAATGDNEVLVASDESLIVLQAEPSSQSVSERQSILIGEAVSALAVCTSRRICASSLWKTHIVAVYSFPDLTPLSRYSLSHGSIARSLGFLSQDASRGGGRGESACHLLCGISDGVVLSLPLGLKGEVGEAESYKVGDVAPALHHLGSQGAMLAHSNRSAVVQYKNGQVTWQRLFGGGGGGIHSILGTDSEGGLAWLGRDGALRKGFVDLEERLRWDSKPLGETPRALHRLASLKCLIVQTEEMTDKFGLEGEGQHSLRLYDEISFVERGFMKLDQGNHLL